MKNTTYWYISSMCSSTDDVFEKTNTILQLVGKKKPSGTNRPGSSKDEESKCSQTCGSVNRTANGISDAGSSRQLGGLALAWRWPGAGLALAWRCPGSGLALAWLWPHTGRTLA
ncbi:hypothetical protein PoB_003743400 [Plakobranchus ocellatus]|uniref:Uncharacterized protein n=1 Tax=Plakobranchus ocellatus TaxID=259542 RepID=A0AAV4AX07_9GAST|nr:hypothetical protein PoB_003743400 [Plakobranchus ocellatus]